jgi:hypothetical protein
MPRDNFGFKGTALTPTQAYEAGASVSSQEYNYAVSLGVITPVLPQVNPVFSNVSVSVPRNWPPNIGSIQTANVSGNNTSVLSIAMSIPGGTLGGNLRVAFTVTEPVILTADDTVITGGDGATLTVVSNTNQPSWYTDKFGSGGYANIDYSYSGDNAYNAANRPSPAPTRLRLLAGTYNFDIEFWQNTGTAKSLSAAFTLLPADTGKVFDAGAGPVDYSSGFPPASSGLYTKKLLLPPATPASPNYLKNYSIPYIYRDSDTVLRLTASSDSAYNLEVPGYGGSGDVPRSPQPQPEGGWYIMANGSQQNKNLTGTQEFTIWTVPSQAYTSNIKFVTRSPGVSAWSLEILS